MKKAVLFVKGWYYRCSITRACKRFNFSSYLRRLFNQNFGYWQTEYYYRTSHNKLISSTVNGLLVLIYSKSIF
jgi:hypothetical protein